MLHAFSLLIRYTMNTLWIHSLAHTVTCNSHTWALSPATAYSTTFSILDTSDTTACIIMMHSDQQSWHCWWQTTLHFYASHFHNFTYNGKMLHMPSIFVVVITIIILWILCTACICWNSIGQHSCHKSFYFLGVIQETHLPFIISLTLCQLITVVQ